MSSLPIDLLIHKYFQGTLSAEEEAVLWKTIRSDSEAADRFVELAELESALLESLRAEDELPSGVQAIVSRTTRIRLRRVNGLKPVAIWPYLAATALFALTLGLFVLGQRKSEDGSLVPGKAGQAKRVDPGAPEPEVATEAPRPALVPPTAPPRTPESVPDPLKAPPLRPELPAKAPAQATPETPRDKPPEKPEKAPDRKEAPLAPKDADGKPPTLAVAKARQAILERVEGDVFWAGDLGGPRLEVAQGVPPGQGVETRGARSLALLRLEDGSRLELRGDSRMEKLQYGEGEKTVTLTRGVLAVTVAKQPDRQSMVLRSPHSETTVLGTRFVLQATPEWTRIDVEEGRVRFRRNSDAAGIEIGPGFFAQAGKGPAPVARPIVVTRSFQDGVLPTPDYSGTQDVSISSGSPTANSGALDQLRVHRQSGDDHQWVALVRWDLSSIPPKSRVLSAEVTFWLTGTIAPPSGRIYELRRPWREYEATWRLASLGQPWQIPGALGEEDRGRRNLASLAPVQPGLLTVALNDAGMAMVQQWILAPQTNCGMAVAREPAGAWDLASRKWATADHRPKLTVSYVSLVK